MRKNWKRLGALLLALVMVLSLVPVTALAARMTDDEVAMDAPDVAVDEAKPAGAVDAAEDVPAQLAEGEEAPTVLFGDTARGEIYISGSRSDNGGVGTTAAQVKNTIYTADGAPWIGSDMRNKSAGTVYATQRSWIVLDLNASVKTITEVTIQYNAKAWATNYVIQVAGADFTPSTYEGPTGFDAATDDRFTGDNAVDSSSTWTTIYTMERNTQDLGGGPTDTINATTNGFTGDNVPANNNTNALTTTVPEGTRYLRIYFTGINTYATGAESVNVMRIEVKGTSDPLPPEQPEQPTVTKYLRKTGEIEPGIYTIFSATSGGRVLYNSDSRTDQVGGSVSNGNELPPSSVSGNYGDLLLWKIAGNATDGYTIQGVTAGKQNYLTTTESTAKSTQLTLSSDSTAAVKLSFEQSGDGYKVSYSDNGTTKYFRLRTTGDGWEFSEDSGTIQLFKETAVPVTIESATDNSRDVGVTDGTYSNSNESVIDIRATSQEGQTSGDGPVTWAVDGNEDSFWHSRYSGTSAQEEIADRTTSGTKGWGTTKMQETVENRWVELDLKENEGAAQWLSGLRYKGRPGENGHVNTCEIRVWDDTAGAWAKVTSDTAWTFTSGDWNYKEFDNPVCTNKVRLYGVTTYPNNQYMSAKEIRLVKALNEAPATNSVTITVNSSDGGALQGATVNGGGKVGTTDENGQVALNLVAGNKYTLSVTAPDHLDGTVTVIGGEGATGEVTLTAITRTISGTIYGKETDEGEATPLADAKVELVQSNNDKTFVRNVKAVYTNNEGKYTLNANSAPMPADYKVRVSKDGYDAVISETAKRFEGDDPQQVHTGVDATLTKIDVASAKFAYTMEANVEGQPATRPTLGFADSGTVPTSSYTEGDNPALTLSFTSTTRMDNLVKLTGTGVKNGTIEFDAHREGTYSNAGRFGLALRLQDSSEWIFIGSENDDSHWFHEWWRGGKDQYSSGTAGPVFGKGDTRHFKVTIKETKISLWIDGIQVINEATVGSNATKDNVAAPSTAADVGFICGNSNWGVPSTITIDNLYIFREDPTYTVTLGTDPALTAQINTSAGDQELGGNAHDQAAEGDTIKITATSPAADTVLDAITVKKAAEGGNSTDLTTEEKAALNIDNPSAGVWTFEMPAFDVSVTGTVLPVVTGVSISGTNKEGKTLTATVTPPGADGKVTYKWYHQANEGQSTDVDDTEDGWTPCTSDGYNAKEKTVGGDDLNRKVRVVVTGNGADYAATVSAEAISSGVMAAADKPVTGVSFTRTGLTMWSNLEDDPDSSNNSVMGNTATLTANVAPDDASPAPTYAWSVVDENGNAVTGDDAGVITLATNTPETNTKQITANKTGKVWVKVTVTGGEKSDGTTSTASATIPVTVKTGITSITLTKGGTELTSASVLTIYANDGDDNQRVTVNAAVNAGASAADLDWSCGHEGENHIFQLGGAEDAGSATGGTVTIAAYDSHTLVGEETVTVSAPTATGNTAQSVSFKVKVVHKISSTEHSVSISGTPKLNNELSVNLTNVPSTVSSDELDYEWKRTKNGTETTVGTDATYTPTTADDVGATFTVTVTAKEESYYEGSLTSAATGAVQKLDAPNAPTLRPNKPSQEGANDGSITIINYNSEYTYQIKVGDAGAWEDATVTSEGKIENLSAGKHFVKVKETDTRKESAAANTSIAAGDAVEYDITATQPTEGATISVTTKATKDTTVEITLTVTDGWQVDAVKVTKDSDNTTVTVDAGEEANTWTFAMPEGDVTVTAEVSKKQVKITHSLSEGLSCSLTDHDEDGNHKVNYGEVTSITLTAADEYNLPTSIKVTYTDGTEAPTERCSYNSSTGVISFPQGIQRNITITATAPAKTFNATFEPAGTTGNLTRAFTSTTPIAYNGTLTATLTPATGYSAPAQADVQVTVGGTAAEFTYAVGENGVATITVNNVKGNVVIKANSAVKNTTAIASVTIGIGHNDTSATGDVPHVGDLLTATVSPTGANVTFQWYADNAEIPGATDATYRIASTDLVGKTIKVKVVAEENSDYTGEKTSEATAPVETYKKPATGITLDKTTASVVYGETLTLTATVTPNDAYDKAVTWTSSNPAVATVAGGVVTPVSAGSATTTITAKNSANQTATCTVTVTAAQVGVTLSGTPKVGQTLTATITPTGATTRSIYWYRVGAGEGGTNVSIDNNNQTTYTLVEADAGYKIMVTVEGTDNYNTGTPASATTESTIASEHETLPTYAITVANDIANGTVTADKTEASAGDTVTLTVSPASGYKLGTLTVTKADSSEVTVTNNTFVMPGQAVTVTATFVEDTTPPTVNTSALEAAITAANAAKEGIETIDGKIEAEVEEGAKFVTTAEMKALTDAIADAEAVKEAAASQAAVDAAVTTLNTAVTTFNSAVKTGTKTPVVTTELDDAIAAAKTAKTGVVTKPAETAEDTVSKGTKYVTEAEMKALTDAITAAETAKNNPLKTDESVAAAAAALNEAVETFKDAVKTGTKQTSSSRPSSSSTVTNPDGSVTTTTTKPDGTKVETTEKPDGTKETVETKRDGTVIETTEKPDGTTESVKTQPDGTVVETVVAPDGTKESVMTKPDGTVTETVIDTEGATTEKVTDPEENVVITVTDPEGEELAKVEIPAEITEPETKFDDAEEHWAKESINKIASLGLVNGMGNNKYGTESSMTRGQLATVLYRLSNGKSGYRVSFSDVEIGKYYTDGVAWAAKAKVVNGYTAEIFAPEDTITREQLAVMLCRYAKLIGMNTKADTTALDKFVDGDSTGAWAVDGMAWCVANGILKGRGQSNLDPTSRVTRAEVAVMLDRFIELIK